MTRPTWAEVDLDAIRDNARALAALATPARLCAVVKADGYGHGAAAAAGAALAGGASWLAVALVEEGVALRRAGVTAPILLLSEPPDVGAAIAAGLTPTVYTEAGAAAAGDAPVHLKIDTGMRRVGADHDRALELAQSIPRLEGVWTHFAVADRPDDPFTAEQARRFDELLADLDAAAVRPPLRHACNSAGLLNHPQHRYDMVRCGLALYGALPGLRPALALRSRVSYVKEIAAGEGVSYGLRYRAPGRTTIATVPIGYADGVPWRLGVGGGVGGGLGGGEVRGEVLIGGRRRPIAGGVTMDQLTVDCGPDDAVRPGDEVVLIGPQGDERITAQEWADRAGTISYEVLAGIGPRVPRRTVGAAVSPAPAS